MTTVLFCSQPFEPTMVDADFLGEREAAVAAGFSVALFDHTEAVEGDVQRAVRRVPEGAGDVIYRGWMLSVERYEALHHALLARGARPFHDPATYRLCHHLPESYPLLEGETPRSIWLPVRGEVDFAEIFDKLRVFGSGPLVVKDYVKSQKHRWAEACFLPRADDSTGVERVVRRFLELTGEDLAGGLVFREYVPLRIVGAHPRSGMPLAAEIRTFWLDGELVLKHAYWGDLAGVETEPEAEWLKGLARRIPSRFFTMDIAQREDGRWTVIELGDGQVAGLPAPEIASLFYQRIGEILEKERRAPGARPLA